MREHLRKNYKRYIGVAALLGLAYATKDPGKALEGLSQLRDIVAPVSQNQSVGGK